MATLALWVLCADAAASSSHLLIFGVSCRRRDDETDTFFGPLSSFIVWLHILFGSCRRNNFRLPWLVIILLGCDSSSQTFHSHTQKQKQRKRQRQIEKDCEIHPLHTCRIHNAFYILSPSRHYKLVKVKSMLFLLFAVHFDFALSCRHLLVLSKSSPVQSCRRFIWLCIFISL